MIYIGQQLQALNNYSSQAICWLSIKIKGRRTPRNPMGHNCGKKTCIYCLGNGKKRSGLDRVFVGVFTDKAIKSLISAEPNQLIFEYDLLKASFLAIRGTTIKRFNKNCMLLFVDSGYKDWFLKEKINYSVAKEIDQHTCTYCNKEYIFVYKNKEGGKGMVPQFDHWFSKTDYPLLALSFYNLIPSCATCNTIKSKAKFNLNSFLHPYVDSNISSTYSFSYMPTGVHSNRIVFKKEGLNSKGINTVNALNLPMIYKGHSEKELQDLIDLKYKYSENYLTILLEKTFGDLGISEQERFRLIFGIEIDEDNYHKRPFSKFKKDIIKVLKTIT
ncbi:hypothetical protein [Arenibacter sp. F20364]|uniref:hypothetical protein n=1 Tax=Arenibacter sp. F20364 TaxID=2926415 RepID=UPI001FF37E9D|nr:hypothetical protein [Arenibacter sp. F20364]MCK0190450.1 hypothetical protein [Arenibacter sp. F20364]